MILIKYQRLWYVFYSISCAAAIFVPTFFDITELQWAIISYSLIIVLIIIFRIINKNAAEKFLSVYADDCDVYKYIDMILEIINSKYVSQRNKIIYRWILIEELLHAGRFDEAINELQIIDIKKATSFYIYSTFRYYLSYSVYYIYQEDVNKAEYEIANLTSEAEKYKNMNTYKSLKASIDNLQYKLMFLRKDYEVCKEHYADIYNSTEAKPISKVFAAYYLGSISLDKNEIEKAKEFFAFASEKGNTLYVAQKARDYLSQC